MKAADVMTRRVVTVRPDMKVEDAARLMLRHRFSGLPVVDAKGEVVGVVTEGDLLRRAETGTQPRHGKWLVYLMSPGRLAQEYTHVHGRRVGEVMARDVVSAGPETPLAEIVDMMEARHVKRVPIVQDGRLVGIVARADLLKVLARPQAPSLPMSDSQVRAAVLAEIDRQTWAPSTCVDVTVVRGTVTLHGVVFDGREPAALRVLAENVAGVKDVRDELTWIEPNSGLPVDQGFGTERMPPGSSVN